MYHHTLARAVGRPVSRTFPNAAVSSSFRPATTTVNQISGIEDVSVANAKPFGEIPGYKILPFIGSAWVYFPIIGKYSILKLHHADMDRFRKFGDIVREKIGHFDLVSCYTLEDLQTVLRHEGKYPNRGELSSLKAYREYRKEWYKTPGIMVLQGKEWYDLRSKTQPYVMKPKLIQAFLGSMQDISQDLVRRILFVRDGKNDVENIMPELYKWALESIGMVNLDARLGCLGNNLDPDSEAVKLISAVQDIFFYMNKLEAFSGNVQWWKLFPSPTWKKFVKVNDLFTKTTLKYINHALEELKKDTSEEKELTVLQSMLRTPDLDISGVLTTTMDLIFGGVDTTSHTEGFLMYELAKNPDKQKKLREEILRVLPSPNDRLTPAAVNELRYMKACIKESMRLHPIIRGLARNLDHDIVLSGYRVPAGSNIFCILQTMNMLERNYTNATQFIPERWLDKENKPNPYVFIPFGIGMRSCIGRRLAEQEMICATTEIFRNFKVEYHGEDVDMQTRMIAIPDRPLKFKFIDHI